MSALNHQQKRTLAQLARRAFNHVGARVRGATVPPTPGDRQADLDLLAASGTSKAFDAWRQEHVADACGKAGLRLCSQLDYKVVEGHFLELLGQHGRAFNAHMQAQSEPRRQMEHLVVAACKKWGFHLSYAESICRTIHRVNLNDATPEVLRLVMITIHARGAAKARKNRREYVHN